LRHVSFGIKAERKDQAMSIGDQVTQDMKTALAGREKERLAALRLIRAELLNAEKETGTLPDDDRQMAILKKMLKQRQESIEQYEKGGRADLADQERREAAVIASYLPESLSEEAIGSTIDAVLAESGTTDPKQLGKVMGLVMARLKATGKPFDGKRVNELVRGRLGG
jgi:uncharacterized protein YqeY